MRRAPEPAPTAVLASLLAVSAAFVPVPAAAQTPATASVEAAEPRIPLVRLQHSGRADEALQRSRALLEESPAAGGAIGLDVLVGHLLDQAGQSRAAAVSFVRAMERDPDLILYSRFRLAEEYAEMGHPEVSAGLVATVVHARTAAPPVGDAIALLLRALAAGGDCRVLGGLEPSRYATGDRRRLELAHAECDLRLGSTDEARRRFRELLEESVGDEPARLAAEHLARLVGDGATDDEDRLLGLAFHQHRDFEAAVRYLAPLVASFDGDLVGDRFELAYTLVRSRFWQEQFAAAARGYAALAARTSDPRLVARALYQQGRCHELLGDAPQAAATYRRVYRVRPQGDLADAALIGAMRLEWRGGQEERALDLYRLLRSRRGWVRVASRAALFLAASDLVQGRTDRAGAWLDDAARAGRWAEPDLSYWRGRLAEGEGNPELAVRRFLSVLRQDLYHPLAQDAARRLRQPALTTAAGQLAQRRLATGRATAGAAGIGALYEAWLLSAGDYTRQSPIAHDLARRLANDPAAAPFVAPSVVAVERWPLWNGSISTPQDKLLALGILRNNTASLERHFPLTDPSLALTRSLLLLRAGEVSNSVQVAEVMAKQAPAHLPEPFLAIGLRRLLFPFAYRGLVVREATAHRVDPFLLVAIMREESRFDPRALSVASARGLTQFVHPTASRMATKIGLDPLEPEDVYRPAIAVALGAAYLEELSQEFDGTEHAVVAAYNAGEPPARMWLGWCYSDETAEYYTKVSYNQTRAYLAKVLSSRAEYRDIQGVP
jgi:soluble lytic murein transglycosylase